ncbi:LOW QUALITY PROTEIN: protein ALP1-like [Rhopalosiphum maidis]|uniref:LOW QUALITY PROTEIN: protein ALP1-like n=1 Tax=Rhopalosiphum maidis TaxID=43146 RepID=UPI000EFF827D|nr:LOW QUALITY PROTEIN: protein ALP1-like [Rhopalosiphum maidis]
MSEAVVRAGVIVISHLLRQELEKKKYKKKRLWIRSWISRRDKYGASSTLLEELKHEDSTAYRNILKMNGAQFDTLLQMIDSLIKKEDTQMRMAIPSKIKLEITLRYLATGDSFKSLQYLFRVSECTISVFLPDVLTAISQVLEPFIKVPATADEWGKIKDTFFHRWNFPMCCGAIDGKHVIIIKRPPGSGSSFYNYKKTYSVILFAMVDGDYCFTYIDIGANGRASDSAIFRDSTLNIALENNTLGVIIGDDAFPLRTNLLKPYSKTGLNNYEMIFNYRLSRARRVVENAFGILFFLPPQAVDQEDFNNGNIIPGEWREHVNNLETINRMGSNSYKRAAEDDRSSLAKYF